MRLDHLELINQTIQDSKSILIPIPEIHGENLVGVAIALSHILKLKGKKVDILSSYVNLQNKFNFLDLSSITSVIQSYVESIITIDTSQYPVDSIKYDRTEDSLRIYLNSPSNKFNSDLVSIHPGSYPYDLIITFDTKNWTQLGGHFLNYPHIFLETPSVAISALEIPHPYSERTIIESEYASSAEIMFEYISYFYPQFLQDSNINNSLLLSLLLTKSKTIFTDKTILKLRDLPNDYDLIIQSLDSIVSDDQRLLIGRILAHLEFIEFEKDGIHQRYAYSKLFTHDFIKTNTTTQDIVSIYRDLFKYLPQNIAGLHIVVDNGKKAKYGYLDFPNLDMINLQTNLEGEYQEGVLVYNYPSDKDIHTAGHELNQKILEILNK
ncbi:MAG: hypothetical protein RLZZ223_336 [Candidatus Parcubacteria bacterium]|jgi:hypothetical protein